MKREKHEIARPVLAVALAASIALVNLSDAADAYLIPMIDEMNNPTEMLVQLDRISGAAAGTVSAARQGKVEGSAGAVYGFTEVGPEYFDDALFIGDSRVVGVELYAGADNLTYYAEGGLTVYSLFEKKLAKVNGKKVSVEEGLKHHKFGKIYLEIGINEMGTGNLDSFMEAYQSVVNRLRELQPDAILFLCGIMYVTEEKSQSDPIFNNENIRARNDRIAQLADGKQIFYLDVNEIADDGNGNLDADYTWDAVHLLGKYDGLWLDYFASHGIVREN